MILNLEEPITKIFVVSDKSKADTGEVKGFVELTLMTDEENEVIILRGYRLKLRQLEGVPVILLDAPAYRSGKKYKKSVFIANKDLWEEIVETAKNDF